jgi:cytosine/uracil/thiamine/allantoin permease
MTCLMTNIFYFIFSVVDDTASEAIDPYDLMDPVDILAKLPSDFYDKIVSHYIVFFFLSSSLLLSMNINYLL